ncbi:MAG: hypothetical protein JOY86_00020 [Candidatus Eremiobacteraeota bacterium]|nr:hypothetical protein [Candidatus Eremiobacteraeota bacterium]
MRGAAIALVALVCAACMHSAPHAGPTRGPLITGAYPSYGHAPDFSWVAGSIAPRPNGCVYLQFDPHRSEPWDGRIALIADPQTLEQFPSGDMVVAFGHLSDAPRGECGAAALDVTQIGEH